MKALLYRMGKWLVKKSDVHECAWDDGEVLGDGYAIKCTKCHRIYRFPARIIGTNSRMAMSNEARKASGFYTGGYVSGSNSITII